MQTHTHNLSLSVSLSQKKEFRFPDSYRADTHTQSLSVCLFITNYFSEYSRAHTHNLSICLSVSLSDSLSLVFTFVKFCPFSVSASLLAQVLAHLLHGLHQTVLSFVVLNGR